MDEHTFVERVQSMTDRLYRICRSILSSDADCQDAVQNAIFIAWQHIHALKKDEACEGWLMRITVNECRKLYKRREPCLPLENHLPSAPGNESFWEIIDSLDEKYRLPLILFYVEQFKTRDIARLLRIPEGTVKRRLHTARQLLKEVLS